MSNVTTQSDNFNPFSAYGEAVNQRAIVGQLLKFTKGDWVTGDDEEVPEGTRFVANMDALMVGWVRWEGGRPTDQQMGKVAQAYTPARRGDLGDTDQTQWETDTTGTPRDPWQLTNYLVLKEENGDKLYTFATSSKGGVSAIGSLCGEYGKHMRARPNEYPVVEIGTRSYKHETFGKIKTPQLNIVGWAPKAESEAALTEAQSDDSGEAAPEQAPKKAKKADTVF